MSKETETNIMASANSDNTKTDCGTNTSNKQPSAQFHRTRFKKPQPNVKSSAIRVPKPAQACKPQAKSSESEKECKSILHKDVCSSKPSLEHEYRKENSGDRQEVSFNSIHGLTKDSVKISNVEIMQDIPSLHNPISTKTSFRKSICTPSVARKETKVTNEENINSVEKENMPNSNKKEPSVPPQRSRFRKMQPNLASIRNVCKQVKNTSQELKTKDAEKALEPIVAKKFCQNTEVSHEKELIIEESTKSTPAIIEKSPNTEKHSPLNENNVPASTEVIEDVSTVTKENSENNNQIITSKEIDSTAEISLSEKTTDVTDSSKEVKVSTTDPKPTIAQLCRSRFRKVQPNLKLPGSRFSKFSQAHDQNSETPAVQSETTVLDKQNPTLENTDSAITQASPAISCPPPPVRNNEFPYLTSLLKSPKKRMENKEIANKRKRYAKGESPPERSKMTMMDLIYWNPSGSPMKCSNKAPKENVCEEISTPKGDEQVDEPSHSSSDVESGNMPGPRLVVGENGEIMIDEESLVIRRTVPEIDPSTANAVFEDNNTTYSSFRKQIVKRGWSNKETAKFYKALSVVGTDFSLMENLLPNRSRRELKLKFKREERQNTKLIDKVLYDPQKFDISIFEEEDDDIEEIIETTKTTSQKRKRKSQKDLQDDENQAPCDKNAVPKIKKVSKKLERKKKQNDTSVDTGEIQSIHDPENNPSIKRNGQIQPRKRRKQKQILSETEEENNDSEYIEDVTEENGDNSDPAEHNENGTRETMDDNSVEILSSAHSREDATENEIDRAPQENEEIIHFLLEQEEDGTLVSVGEISKQIVNRSSENRSDVIDERANSSFIEEVELALLQHNEGKNSPTKKSEANICEPQIILEDSEQDSSFVEEVELALLQHNESKKHKISTNQSQTNICEPQLISEDSVQSITDEDTTTDSADLSFADKCSSEVVTAESAKIYVCEEDFKDVIICNDIEHSTSVDKSPEIPDIVCIENIITTEECNKSSGGLKNRSPKQSSKTCKMVVPEKKILGRRKKAVFAPRLKECKKSNELNASKCSPKKKSVVKNPVRSNFTPAEQYPNYKEKYLEFTPSRGKTYARKKVETSTQNTPKLILSSLQTPMFTPERSNCLPTSTLQTTLSNLPNRTITIPLTPSPSANKESPVMVFTQSPNEHNVVHVFMYNNNNSVSVQKDSTPTYSMSKSKIDNLNVDTILPESVK